MSRIFNDITELIGSTPLMSLKRFAPGVRLAAKLERTNPTGSAKDRAALSMIRAAEAGALSLEKLEAMTCVCSVCLDMIAIPGDTSVEAICGIIADECAIGMINNKTTAVRVIPAIGKTVGDRLEFGGLLGYAPVMPVNRFAGTTFAHRGGRMPAPLNALKN